MHKMESTSRITTIIGLIFEGLGVLGMALGAVLTGYLSNQGTDFFLDFDFSQAEADLILSVASVFSIILTVLAIIVLVIFLINLVLFTKMIFEKYDEETAKKIYLYQAIWGGVNLLFNQILGILYLVSGIQGRSAMANVSNKDKYE